MEPMARDGHMLCDYESSVQTSDEETVGGLTECDVLEEKSQEEVNRKELDVHDQPSSSSSSDTSHSLSRLPASYSKRTRHRYSSDERSSRHHKKQVTKYDHRRMHRTRTSSRKHSSRSPKRSSRHRRSSRRHRRRDSHHRDRRARRHSGHRRSHHRHRRSSSSSSDSSSSREASIKSCRSHDRKNLTQAILTDVKDAVINRSKPIDTYSEKKSDSNTATNQINMLRSEPIVHSNGAPYSKEVLSTNLAVQRLNAQEVLDKIQKHQEAQAQAQAKAAAAAANLPKYYNPCSVNAIRLAEQQQKRKLLWSKKDTNESKSDSKTSLWASTSLIAGKGNSAAAAKFRKLMGIHDPDPSKPSGESETVQVTNLDARQRAEAQEELFRSLEHIYEMSRTQTHTQRGVGLGFSAASHVDYTAYSAMQNDSNDKKL